MKQLLFQYTMEVAFSDYVGDHSFTLKCIPSDTPKQEIRILRKEISPSTWLSIGEDSFHNEYIYGKSAGPHKDFTVLVEGEASVDRFRLEEEVFFWDYMEYPTPLTTCSENMCLLADNYKNRFEQDPKHFSDHIYALMEEIYSHMTYTSGSTDVTTSASTAWEQKQGVCQDYAHIMLAICRKLRIPCLYIAGFMVGEGSSHAWVRVYDSYAQKSYDIDPTNHCWVNDNYIDVIKGKDAHDCKMNKGIYKGLAKETQKVTVIVKES